MALSDFSELCRLCGSKTSLLMGLHIFEREGDLRQIYKKIHACLPIQVHTSDKLPKMVCEECVYKLDALFEFRERSLKTEFELNSMLKELYGGGGSGGSVGGTTVTVVSTLPHLQMDSLICQSHHTTDPLHIPTPVQVVGLTGSGSELSEIVLLEEESRGVKCEPAEGGYTTSGTNTPNTEHHRLTHIHVHHIRTLESMDDASLKSDDGVNSSEGGGVRGEGNGGGDFLSSAEATPQPWFFCNICGKPFDSSTEFTAHCEIHWKKCGACGATCANDEALLEHLREAHAPHPITSLHHSHLRQQELEEEEDPLNSSVMVEEDEEEKEDVELEEEGEEDRKNEVVEEPKSLQEELQSKTDMKSCLECGKQYRTNYKLSEHMRKHTGEKPFKCSMCEKAFRSKIGLAQHEARHTGHFDYTCSTCGKGFQCKSYLIVHQRVHSDVKPYPCDTCGRHFKSKQSLLDHQNRHLGVKPYMCETCGRGFITKGLCKSHQKVHSGTDNRQYPCTVCNKLFVSKSYLATHLRIHTGEKPFMCEVCGKGFLTRVDLRIHSTMHTGEKSFVCEVCGKAFARRDALRCHKRSHTGERPYRCDICGQGFTQFSPMAIHKRLHTGERPYSCDVCEKTFVSKSTMMSHRKKHNN